MKHYRKNFPRRAKAKKILFRILYVLTAAAVIFTVTAVIGNHLKDKVSALPDVPDDGIGSETDGIAGSEDEHALTIPEKNVPIVSGMAVDIISIENDDDMIAAVDAVAKRCDTAVIDLFGGDGKLIYTSPAVCAVFETAMSPNNPALSENDPVLERLKATIAYLKQRDMRISANVLPITSLESPDGIAADMAFTAELCSLGFDEIMINGITAGKVLDSKSALMISLYVTKLTSAVGDGCDVGITLPARFLNGASIRDIQSVISSASFVGVTFEYDELSTPTDNYASVYHDITSLLGVFNMYSLRALIDVPEPDAASVQFKACTDAMLTNLCFTSHFTPEELDVYTDDGGDTSSESDANEDEKTNPYTTGAGGDTPAA